VRKPFFILTLFIFQFAKGQQIEIDSLINLLKTDKKDTSRLISLYRISDLYETIGNYSAGIKYGTQAILFADYLIKTNKNKINLRIANKYKAKTFNNLGIIYFDQGNYPEALRNYFASLKIKEITHDKKGIAGSYNNIGNVYCFQGNYTEALKNYFASLSISEALGDKKGISDSDNNIGNIYFKQGNYPEALKNYVASLKIREEISDKNGMADSFGNIANVYKDQGKYPEALKNYIACLKIREPMGDKNGIATCYLNISLMKLNLNKTAEAKQYLENGLALSKAIGAKDLIMEFYDGLAQVDNITGNYKSQVANYKLFILYRDSIDNEETRKKTIQNQMTYDFEKKEAIAAAEHKSELKNQAKIAEEKNRKQKLITYFVIGGLLLVIVFALFVFRSLRVTKKQKMVIEKQKLAVELQQKEIIDSIHYAKRIQTALLPSNKNIEKNFNRLKK